MGQVVSPGHLSMFSGAGGGPLSLGMKAGFGWIGPWGPLATSGAWGWLGQMQQSVWNLVSVPYNGARSRALGAHKTDDPLGLASQKSWQQTLASLPDGVAGQ